MKKIVQSGTSRGQNSEHFSKIYVGVYVCLYTSLTIYYDIIYTFGNIFSMSGLETEEIYFPNLFKRKAIHVISRWCDIGLLSVIQAEGSCQRCNNIRWKNEPLVFIENYYLNAGEHVLNLL